ncbi:hypothetical protein ADK88_04735, partial [Streptomyces sp. NRRL F-2295]
MGGGPLQGLRVPAGVGRMPRPVFVEANSFRITQSSVSWFWLSGAGGQGAAGPAAGAGRLELAAVVLGADDDAGGGGAAPEAFDVGGEPGGAARGPLGGGGEHRSG